MYVCIVITYYSKGKDQPGNAANPARGQLNSLFVFFLSPFAPENSFSEDGFGSPVPHKPVHHLYTQSGRIINHQSSIWCLLTGFLPSSAAASTYISFKPPYAIGSVPSLSCHAIAYRWWSLPRVHRHRAASKPQGNSVKRVLLPFGRSPWTN